jgi:hypothetical protein
LPHASARHPPPRRPDGGTRKDAEKSLAGTAAMQAKGDTAKAELEAIKAEIALRVTHAQLAAFVCGP